MKAKNIKKITNVKGLKGKKMYRVYLKQNGRYSEYSLKNTLEQVIDYLERYEDLDSMVIQEKNNQDMPIYCSQNLGNKVLVKRLKDERNKRK